MLGIRVVSLSGAALDTPPSATFGTSGGDIGRGAECTLVLADPERRISRRQAVISWREGRHYIRQIGANLDVAIDGVPLPRDVDCLLNSGAALRIGPYALLVERDDAEPPSSAASDRAATDPAATVADLVAALYAGMGLPVPSAGPTPQDLRRIGGLLRGAIEGTLTLLASRSIAKRELGGGATLPRPLQNNPLKFAPGVEAALAQLLGPEQRGFIEARAAVDEAYSDLRAHEIALLAGMRAAVSDVVARFEPAKLEARLAAKAMWENRLPGLREARLWTLFSERYPELARDIEGEFGSMAGQAFVEAYDRQFQELASARRPGPRE